MVINSSGKKKIYIGIIILFLFLPLLIFLYSNIRESISYTVSKIFDSPKNSTDKLSTTKFSFISEIPSITITKDPINTFFLTHALRKLNLFPFENLPYILQPKTGISRVFPEEVEVRFLPIESYSKQLSENSSARENTLQEVIDENKQLILVFVAGELTNSQKRVTIPVYVDASKLHQELDVGKTMAGYALISIYYTFHTPPLSVNGSDPGAEFMTKMGVIQDVLFRTEQKSTEQSFFFPAVIKNLKKLIFRPVYAQCGGTAQCGTAQSEPRCSSGPYAGQSCSLPSGGICPGLCVSTPVCISSGGAQSCVPGGVGVCAPPCSSCIVSNSCTGTPVFNYCDRNGPGTNDCDDVNVGTSCNGGTGTCQVTSGGAVIECSCAPNPTPANGSVACNGVCTTNAQCSGGRICSGNRCRNSLCTAQTNCICPASTSTPIPTSVPPTVAPTSVPPTVGPTAPPASLNVTLTANNPATGNAPLNNVDLIANVGGTQTGNITYRFDCTNDGSYEITTGSIATNPYTAVDLCDYALAGTYTARVNISRGALTAQDTVTITVGAAPTNTPGPTATRTPTPIPPTPTRTPTPTPIPPTNTPIINPPPVVNLLVNGSDNPPAISSGSTVTVSWTVSNANLGCTAQASQPTNGWVNGTAKTSTNGTHSQNNVGGISLTTTITINCSGSGGSNSDSVQVQVVPPATPPTVTLTVNGSSGPLAVNSGSLVTVGWTVSNATSCTSQASVNTGNWVNGAAKTATTGSHTQTNVGSITSNRTIQINCTGPGGNISDTVDLTLAVNAVTVDLKVNGGDGPVSVPSGNNVNVTWTVTNAINPCTATANPATPNWTGTKSQAGGSQNNVGPINVPTVVTLTCPGSGGTSSTDSVQLNLVAAPTPTTVPVPIVDLKVNGQDTAVVAPNALVNVTWTTSNAISCESFANTATGNWVNGVAKTTGIGSQNNVGPISSGRTLTLTCDNTSGVSRSDNVPIVLATPSPTPGVNQCQAPAPRDPPITDCSTGGVDTVTITWQWPALPLPVNQYVFAVQDDGGTIVSGPTTLNAGAICVAGTCTTTTNLVAGTYRSVIVSRSSTNVCNQSTASYSNYITVPLCSAVSPPTVTLLVNGSGGPVSIVPGALVDVSWTTTDASVCTASTTNPAAPTTTGWSGSVGIFGTLTGVGPITTDRSLTISCTGPDGTITDTVELNLTAPATCGATLHDPPTVTCAISPANGSISWEWNHVGGAATNYIVDIYNQATGTLVTSSGNAPLGLPAVPNFAAPGAPCNVAGSLCRYTTNHQPGTSYYSIIRSLGATCTEAVSLPSSPVAVNQCPGIYQARAHRISPADVNNCSATTTPLDASMSFTPNIDPGLQNTSAAYTSWNDVTPGTYTLSSTVTSAPGYILQTACVDSNINANPSAPSALTQAISSNETISYDLFYTYGTPWSRGQDGDMMICTDVRSTIPTLANPNPDFVLPGPGGYPGIVSYGTSFDFDGSGAGGGASNVSSTNWLANEAIPTMCTTNWYQYFANKMDISSLTPIPNTGTKGKNDFTAPVNLINGNVTLGVNNGSWNLGSNANMTIFVNGNVTIEEDITYNQNSFFALIVNGNITVAPTVGTDPDDNNPTPNLQGLYVTSPVGRFITGQSSNPDTEQLIVKGTVIAGGFILQRDLDSKDHNQDIPAEDFIYDPELLLTMPDSFKDLRIKWEEVAP